jgi:quercetin dioxygenase-like cupin family protein
MACKHYRWEEVAREELNPLLARQMISGEKVMAARIYLRKGAIVPAHKHESEQVTCVLEGCLRFQFDQAPPGKAGETIVKAGEVFVVPSNLGHGVEALEDTVSLDIFSPIREDWLRGDDQYLRKT